MYNKKSIIIFSLIALILIGGLVYVGIDLFGIKENIQKESEVTTSKKNIFNFLDFGKKTNTNLTNENSEDISSENKSLEENKRLVKITSKKISSYDFYQKEEKIPTTLIDGKQDFVTILNTGLNFIDSENGLVYELPDEATENTRLSNNTTPFLGNSLIGNNGKSVIYQYNKLGEEDIETYVGSMSGPIPPYNLKGFFLPKNIKNIITSPKKDKFFYTISTQNGVIGIIQAFESNKKIQPWSSTISEWISDWSNENTITLTTKPSANIDGYSYFLSLDSGRFTKILGPEKGLITKTSPNTSNVLYSKTENGRPVIYIYNTVSKTSKNLGFSTLAEKCIWSDDKTIYCAVPNSIQSANYPDDWYMGEVSFTDSLWKINIEESSYTNIGSFTETENIDAIDLKNTKDFLYFINKNTGNLWRYSL